MSLFLMIISCAVGVKFSTVRPLFEDNPDIALLIAVLASIVYVMADSDY